MSKGKKSFSERAVKIFMHWKFYLIFTVILIIVVLMLLTALKAHAQVIYKQYKHLEEQSLRPRHVVTQMIIQNPDGTTTMKILDSTKKDGEDTIESTTINEENEEDSDS